jgi:putative ABC transport system permease protein
VNPVLACLVGLFALGYGPVAVFALRHRELGRLAVREAVRRKGQSLLVVAGLMVGTAAITAALVAADSAQDSSLAMPLRNWGSVDLTVTGGNQFFPTDVAARLAADQAVARVTDGVSAGIDLAGSASDLGTRESASQITLVGFDPSAQKPFGAYVLTTGRRTLGQDLAPDDVLLSRVLAGKLGARTGDRVHVSVNTAGSAGSAPVDLRVAGIAQPEGPGGYTLGSVVFARLETAQRIASTDQINIIRISTPGGIRDSVAAAHRAAPVVERAVAALGSQVPLQVREAKASDIANSEANSQFFRALLVGMSALVVVAGAALVVNLTVMLAEERRPRLGVLRALGLTRRRLMGFSITEGALYSLVAGVLGTAAGAAADRLVSDRFGDVFAAYAGPDYDLTFLFSLKPATLAAGFTVGTVLTLAVIFVASRRTSRMTIVAAIRDLPEPPAERNRHPRMRAAWLSISAAAGGVALALPHFPRLVGGIVLILALSALARPRLSRRSHATLAGLALAGWPLGVIGAAGAGTDPGTFLLMLVVGMLTAVFGLTIAVSASLPIAEAAVGLLGRASASLRAVLRPPLAYLSLRPLRTGLTTGVFAVIVGMLTLFSVLYVINRPDYERFGNGYDVRIRSTGSAAVPLPAAVRADVTRSVTLSTRGYIGRVTGDGPFSSTEREFLPLFQVGLDVAGDPPVRLGQRDHRFRTDRAVWAAVIRDPSLVVTNIGTPGQKFTLQGQDGPVTFTIAGSQPFGLLDGVFGTGRSLGPFRAAPQGATMLLDLRDPAQSGAVARSIKDALFTQGVDADSVQSLADRADRANRAWLSVIGALIRMGLVVGILGLGIVALRTVTERRHAIGIMRAIGYKRRGVILALLTESAVTATIGTAVGVVAGITMGYLFYRQSDSQPGFGLDLAGTGNLLGLIYLAVVLVTIGPAWRASRLPPAEAIRSTE